MHGANRPAYVQKSGKKREFVKINDIKTTQGLYLGAMFGNMVAPKLKIGYN